MYGVEIYVQRPSLYRLMHDGGYMLYVQLVAHGERYNA
jgi:hypothetical protein